MNRKYFLRLDWVTLGIYLILSVMGLVNLYAASYSEGVDVLQLDQTFGKQLFFVLISILIIIGVQIIGSKLFERFSSIFYLTILLALLGLYVFGHTVSGATSWYSLGGFSFQPSEIAKVITALALSKHLSDFSTNINRFRDQLTAFILILLPAFIILPQPDPGSALVFFSFFFVLHVEGLSSRYLLSVVGAVVLFILTLLFEPNAIIIGVITLGFVFFLFSKKNKKPVIQFLIVSGITLVIIGYIFSVNYIFEHIFEQRHRDRINIVIGKEYDPQGIGYNINQSQIAIGSGGVWGKGFLEGTQTQGDFVPEKQTDYIFTIVAEEWGFVGSFIVIALFITLMLRIMYVSQRQKNSFSRIYCYCVVCLLFTHFSVNLGMVLGIFPTIGIPLPFFSYGGSSILGFSLLLAIYFKLDGNRINEW